MLRVTSKKSLILNSHWKTTGCLGTCFYLGQPSNRRILVPQSHSLPQDGPPVWNIIFGIQNLSIKLLGEKTDDLIWRVSGIKSMQCNPCKELSIYLFEMALPRISRNSPATKVLWGALCGLHCCSLPSQSFERLGGVIGWTYQWDMSTIYQNSFQTRENYLYNRSICINHLSSRLRWQTPLTLFEHSFQRYMLSNVAKINNKRQELATKYCIDRWERNWQLRVGGWCLIRHAALAGLLEGPGHWPVLTYNMMANMGP